MIEYNWHLSDDETFIIITANDKEVLRINKNEV